MRLIRRTRGPQAGYNLVEVTVTLAILVIVSQAFITFTGSMQKRSGDYMDRMMANEKALQMLEELRKVVQEGEARGGSVSVLDNYKDAGVYRYMLTTNTVLTHSMSGSGQLEWRTDEWRDADQYLSGNPVTNNGYRFVRTIDVMGIPNDTGVRKVFVRVYAAKANPGKASASTALPDSTTRPPMAEVFGMLRSGGYQDVPTQVMDVYLIALENVPGWWARVASLRDLMQTTVSSLAARNPGLEIRTHWIKRMSFGRDKEYTPETNLVTRAGTNGAFDKTYVYPGNVLYSAAPLDPALYYDPNWFSARVNVDGAVQNAGSYSLADQYNHAMRYYDEEELFDAMTEDAARAGFVPEISLRMLIEGMNNPSNRNYKNLRNSIIINLHGELIPVLPLRNVSDAAKDPIEFPGKAYRAVTHPEKLRFQTASDPVALRVYAYNADMDTSVEGDAINVVTVFLPNRSLNNLQELQRMQGSSSVPYKWLSNNAGTWASGLETGPTAFATGGISYVTDNQTYRADNFIDPQGRRGLRIRMYGVSTTARDLVTTTAP
jgi:hypothetical protein